jgi:hydroxymethylpyrimidine/phosphomethylpyrimidine kinase
METKQKTMRPFCLTIAGHDPSGGAGVLADVKVFEHLSVSGLSVVSALTFQNDSTFEGVEWTSSESIHRQIELLQFYPVKAVKIGLIESIERLEQVVDWVRHYFPKAYLLWDPILSASAGYVFHEKASLSESLTQKIQLITPNYEEYLSLQLNLTQLPCSVLLKGGHRFDMRGTDTLYSKGTAIDIPGPLFTQAQQKHGSGCVLSAAIAGYMVWGNTELKACINGKKIVERLMRSNNTRLGNL